MGAYSSGRLASRPRQADVVYVESDDITIEEPQASPSIFGNADPNSKDILAGITAFLPAEALAFHTLAGAFLGEQPPLADAILTFAILALVSALVLLGWFRTPHNSRAKDRLVWAIALSTWAAAAYMAAMPDSFAHEWDFYTPTVGGLVALASAILIPNVASACGFGVRMHE